ncbi:MAG: winged helix-turn-helix transcriptional regulator [Thermoplasmataceae archaeon]
MSLSSTRTASHFRCVHSRNQIFLWSLQGISTGTLSSVLKEFIEMGIIEPFSKNEKHGYRLTQKGEDLAEVVAKIKL